MRALVIGASGGIGGAVCAALRVRGADVVGLSRSGDGLDVTEEGSVARVLGAEEGAQRFGIPAERVKAIRAAFDKMIVDPEFLKDATQAKLDIDPAPAAAIEKVIEIFAKTSEATGAKLRDAIDPKLSK